MALPHLDCYDQSDESILKSKKAMLRKNSQSSNQFLSSSYNLLKKRISLITEAQRLINRYKKEAFINNLKEKYPNINFLNEKNKDLTKIINSGTLIIDNYDSQSLFSLDTDEDINDLTLDINNVNYMINTENINDQTIINECYPRVIMLCIDISNKADQIALWARKHILKKNDIVVIVTIFEEMSSISNLNSPGMILLTKKDIARYNNSMMEKYSAHAKRIARTYLNDLYIVPLTLGESSMTKTSISNLLCRVARELNPDYLVCGSNGHNQLRKVLFGSITKSLQNNAHCPVLYSKLKSHSIFKHLPPKYQE